MNMLTLIHAVRGVRPFLPCILMLPLALGACSGAGSNPAADVAALETRLTAAEDVAIDYIRLPPCASSNGPPCSDSVVVARIRTADMRAYTLVKTAEQTVGDPAAASAAQAAVAAMTDITASLPHQGSEQCRSPSSSR
jgi:pyrimidine deaminase RibD-like protein